MTENDIMTLFKGLYSRDNARKLMGALQFVLPPKRDGSVFINKYEGQVLRTVPFTMPTSLINKFKELVIKTIDKVNKGIGFPLYQCDFISKNDGENTTINLAVKMTPVTQEVLDFLHIDEPLDSVTDILSNNEFLLDFKYPSEYRIANSDNTSTLLKQYFDKNYLYSGYEKDLEFLKSACKLVTLDKHSGKNAFLNFFQGSDGLGRIKSSSNFYVLLQLIPNITSQQTRDTILKWYIESPVDFYVPKDFKDIKEIVEFESSNKNLPPNIKW